MLGLSLKVVIDSGLAKPSKTKAPLYCAWTGDLQQNFCFQWVPVHLLLFPLGLLQRKDSLTLWGPIHCFKSSVQSTSHRCQSSLSSGGRHVLLEIAGGNRSITK